MKKEKDIVYQSVLWKSPFLSLPSSRLTKGNLETNWSMAQPTLVVTKANKKWTRINVWLQAAGHYWRRKWAKQTVTIEEKGGFDRHNNKAKIVNWVTVGNDEDKAIVVKPYITAVWSHFYVFKTLQVLFYVIKIEIIFSI